MVGKYVLRQRINNENKTELKIKKGRICKTRKNKYLKIVISFEYEGKSYETQITF